MTHANAALCTRALRLLLPASGRHRAPAGTRPPAPVEQPPAPPLSGEEIGLVRPYVVAHETRLRHLRAARRRTLRIAPRGLRIGVER